MKLSEACDRARSDGFLTVETGGGMIPLCAWTAPQKFTCDGWEYDPAQGRIFGPWSDLLNGKAFRSSFPILRVSQVEAERARDGYERARPEFQGWASGNGV